jgi:catechol 2,3-dioxygenase
MIVSPAAMSIGHVGIFVRDLDTMTAFYRDVLGFVLTDQGERIRFLSRDPRQHHQVVLAPGRPPGGPDMIQQLSFRVDSLAEVKAIHARLAAAKGVTGIDPLTHGNAWSVYFRDPEGNRIEFYADTPWYVPQPFRRPMDYTQPLERIHAETLAICEATPGFLPVEEWEAGLSRKLGRTPAEAHS